MLMSLRNDQKLPKTYQEEKRSKSRKVGELENVHQNVEVTTVFCLLYLLCKSYNNTSNHHFLSLLSSLFIRYSCWLKFYSSPRHICKRVKVFKSKVCTYTYHLCTRCVVSIIVAPEIVSNGCCY